MSDDRRCTCPGSPIGLAVGEQCPGVITQEDLLCDHCREFDCPTVTTWRIREQRTHAQMVRRGELLKAPF